MTVTRKETLREREAGISPRGFAARSRVLSVFASLDRNQMKESMRCLRAKDLSGAL